MFNKFLNKLHYLFFLISLFIFIYAFYRSEIFYDGTIRFYYIQFYFISIIFLILGLTTFFLKIDSKKNLFLTFFSIILSFYILETLLLFKENIDFITDKKIDLYEKQTGKKFDNRENLIAYIEEKEKKPDLKIKIGPHHYVNETNIDFFPLSGISNSFTFYCNENGYFSYYNTDRHGFRNPNTVWDEEIINYLLVGDSFTLGACVNSPNDISSRLRNLFKSKSVLNLGYGGNGPLISYAVLREYLPKKKVRNVLFLFYEENELDDLIVELKNPILKKYYNDKNFSQNLFYKQKKIDETNIKKIDNSIKKYQSDKINRNKFLIGQTLKLFRIRTSIDYLFNREKEIEPKDVPQFKKILNDYKKITKENNSNFFFVYLPTFHRYNNNFDNLIYNETLKILNELDIKLIDIKKEFDKHPNPKSLFPFGMYAHYNIEGYKFVSNIIFNELNK